MSVLLAGKPELELSVCFSRHKIPNNQPSSNSWDSRYVASEGPSVQVTEAPASSSPKSPPCGMCVRTASSATTSTPSTEAAPMSTASPSDLEQATPPSSGDANHAGSATIMDIAIRCTAPNCSCEGFVPSKPQIRSCDSCQHGWVAHALDKLGFRHMFNCHSVEMVQPTTAFDVASLMLYGTEALPIRLKILLDRLFSVLKRDEVINVLHGFGWTHEDYTRGYILQDVRGNVLERWAMPSREEEPLILQQFLRFGETQPIAQQLLLQDSGQEKPEPSESDIKRFVQRTAPVPAHLGRPPKPSTPLEARPHTPLMPPLAARGSRPPSNVSSTASMSPTKASPVNSPLSSSPLNKLQNMLPYDFRREQRSPETRPTVPIMSYPHHATPLPSPTGTVCSLANTSFSLVSNSINSSFMVSSSSSRLCMASDLSLSATDEGSGNETDGGAINLSQHSDIPAGHPHLDSIFAAKKIRHLRKSANPMKRRWNPMMLSGLTTNPTTGKKRVQCHVCLKTFCDKGALKIHFSAVHLREMHKCTVDGCNMMFSSRRSRNRHSANPNPKLHTPNLRRKMSHHDGRSSLPYPLIPSTTLMNFNNSNNNMLSVPPTLHTVVHSDVDGMDRTGHHMDVPTKTEINQPNIAEDYTDASKHAQEKKKNTEEVLQLSKKQRLELNGDLSNDGDEGIDLSIRDDANQVPNQNKGVRKRKSFNPTKCTAASDDDLQYVTTDDSSSDTFVDDNGLLSKSDEFSSDLLEDDSKDEDIDKDSSSAQHSSSSQQPTSTVSCMKYVTTTPHEISSSFKVEEKIETKPLSFCGNSFRAANLTAKENDIGTLDLSSKHRDPVIKPNPEAEEVSESPLRHLESLSLGAFTGLLNHTKSTFSHHISSSTGISFHAPGLGLASAGPTPISESMNREKTPRLNTEPQPIPVALGSAGVHMTANDSESDGQIHMLPMYRDASMVSAIDVPVDKENPRRCIACGKIFQNHFGVKTHYQNVHLKVMHKCTVEGCNAAFPSKRSRDRHSANLNLHRKLLSTTAEKSHFFDKGSAIFPFPPPGAALRDDYFSRLYDPQSLPLNFADFYHGRFQEGFLSSSPFGGHLGMPGPLGIMPNFHPTFMVPTSTSNSSLHESGTAVSDGRDDTPLSSISSTPSPRLHSPSSPSSSSKDRPRCGRPPLSLDSELVADSEGRFSCNFCQRVFAHAPHLKDHYEGTHLPSLVPCPSEDCHKVFLTKADKDKHCTSEDHSIHRIKTESPS